MATPVQVSTYDAMATLPRLRGDGMDSVLLNKSATHEELNTKKAPIAQRNRYNLQNSSRAATIAKTQSPKFVPKEPVKGAVGPTDHNNKAGTNTGMNKPVSRQLEFGNPSKNFHTSASSYVPTSNSLSKPLDESKNPIPKRTNCYSNIQNTASKPRKQSGYYSNEPETSSFCVQRYSTEPSLTANSLKFSQPTAPPRLTELTTPASLSEKRDVVLNLNLSGSDTALDFPSPPEDDERTVEGDISDDKEEIKQLRRELEDLSRVNADLKKLLVASVGDDLHWKMDALIRTKIQLATEIGGYTEKHLKDHEELDNLSIQADMWRSKFMATRVLIDQLSSEKEACCERWGRARQAMEQLLQERQQLYESMVETHRYVKFLRDSLDPCISRKQPSLVPNILELARTNLLLAEDVKHRLLGGATVLAAALDAGLQNGMSPAEKLAYQVLMSDVTANQPKSHPVPGGLSAQVVSKYRRFHPKVRYEGFTFTCCAKCKGDVQVL